MNKANRLAFLLMLILCVLALGCAVAESDPADFKYTTITCDDGTTGASVTGYSGSDASVVVPATLGGYPVKEIGSGAFYGSATLESITLPVGMNTIGINAFYQCSVLQSVSIAEGLTKISSYAFYQCYALQSVILPDSLVELGILAFSADTALPCALGSDLAKLISKSKHDFVVGDFAYRYLFDSTGEQTGLALNKFTGADTNVDIPAGVTKIGDSAFKGCTTLQSVVISDGVTEIGGYCFSGCTTLQSVTLPDGLTSIGGNAFYDCTALLSVSIPAGVTTINEWAFLGCTSLQSVTLPDGLTAIGDYAFSGCSALQSVALPDSLVELGTWAFSDNTALPCALGSNLAKLVSKSGHDFVVKDYSLRNLFDDAGEQTGLALNKYAGTDANVDISVGVTTIGRSAFSGCTSLQSIALPESLTTIGSSAFYKCTALQSVNIPVGVTSIGITAFSGCTSLQSIALPESLTTIGSSAFPSSTALPCAIGSDLAKLISKSKHDFVVGDCSLRYLFDSAGVQTGLTLNKYTGAETSVDVPVGVTSVGEYAFMSSDTLKRVTLPDGLVSIENQAFYECTALQSVIIPAGLTRIGDYAFSNCISLKFLQLPDSVIDIGDDAFCDDSCSTIVHVPCVIGSALAKTVSKNGNSFWVDGFFLKYEFDGSGNTTGLLLTRYDGAAATARVPNGVTKIDTNAMMHNQTLKALTLPETMRSLEEDCLPFTDVYGGSLEAFVLPYATLSIDYQMLYTYTTPVTIYCYEYTTGAAWARQMAEQFGCKVVLLDGKTPPDYVKLSFPQTASVNLGAPYSVGDLLSVNPYPVEGLAIDWVSSDPAVATVDENGLLTPITAGQTRITATARDYPTLTASVLLTVKKPIVSFDLPDELWLPARASEPVPVLNLTPADATPSLTWRIENTLVATVSADGVVTALSLGETTLTAVSDSGVSRTCTVKVIAPVSAVTIEPTTLTLYQSETRQVTATAKAGAVTAVNRLVTFTSDDPAVAAIDDQGNVTGVSAGTTFVRATSGTGITAACEVTVLTLPTLRIPAATKTIEADAFADAAAYAVVIPDGCATIGAGAFRHCTNLLMAVLPASVTTIGEGAFADCPNVVIHCPADSEAQRYAVAHDLQTVNP